MLKNQLVAAFRSLLKEKLNLVINTCGLAVGFACFVLILAYVNYERGYDRFHKNKDRIFRVVTDEVLPNGKSNFLSSTPGPVGPALAHDFPDVENYVRLTGATMLMQHEQNKYQEEHIYFADATIFDVFSFPLIRGDQGQALAAPFSIVLTQSSAARYFGDKDPMGQTLLIDREVPFTVTGVIADLPVQSHLNFDMLLSMSTRNSGNQGWLDGWDWSSYTYLLLNPGAEQGVLQDKLPSFIEAHTGEGMMNTSPRTFLLQPLVDLHLYSNRSGEPGTPGNSNYLNLFTIVAIFILAIACVNFVNLSTAQAAKRAKEVGLRKAIGASQLQLVKQFLLESIIVSVTAALIAVGTCDVLLPLFRTLVDVPVSLKVLFQAEGIVAYMTLATLVGCLAGAYPAFHLSKFRPAVVLKGQFKSPSGAGVFRESLIVFQFALSIALIVATITVYSQLNFMQHLNLGYNKEQVVAIAFGDDELVQEHISSVIQQLATSPFVDGISASSHLPGNPPGQVRVKIAAEDGVRTADMARLSTDYDFVSLYGLQLTAGRAFSRAFVSDSLKGLMINEAACFALGFTPDEVLGKQLTHGSDTGTVVGVIKNFHYATLHSQIAPMLVRMRAKSLAFISLRLPKGQVNAAMADLQKRWRMVVPHRPFDYSFLDQQFNNQYRADIKFRDVFAIAAGLAILLASLGLFGLVSLTVQQRTKEIGIRKVLGATTTGLLALFYQDFIRPIGIALLLASPVAWLALNRWLQEFAYRTALTWWMFAAAGIAASIIALLTISMKALHAARLNPVQSLRSE